MEFDKVVPSIAIWLAGFIRGVPIFFAMSAFLICASVERSKSVKEYMFKRFIRIYPELWMAVILNAVIVFAILGTPVIKGLAVWLFIQSFGVALTPHTFDSFATGSLNGAMWTIFVMIQSYVVLYFAYKYLKRLKTKGWIILISVFAAINMSFTYVQGVFEQLASRTIIPYALWFLLGAMLYIKRERAIPLLKKYFWVYSGIYIIFSLINTIKYLGIPGYYCSIIHGIFLPLITVGFAYKFKNIKIKNDISYEIYLFHWIVINLMVYFNVFSYVNWIICLVIYVLSVFAISYIANSINKIILKHI